MKIAHLTTVDMSLRYLLLPQLEAARAYGEVIGISAPGDFVPEIEERGIRHVPLTSSTRGVDPLADLRAAWQLWGVLKSEKPDILHTHNPKPGVYGRILGRVAGVPIIVNTVHGLYATPQSSLLKRAVVYGLEWLAARFSDAELIQSPEDYRLIRRLRIMPRRKVSLLGNGVDLGRFRPDAAGRDSIRKEVGADVDKIVVGLVGRLVGEKGVPELIEAAESLGADYVVVVAGPHDPDKEDSIPEWVVERGRQAGVRFLGMRRDTEQLYAGFDIFVLPSHREGFPRAAMEAAASGLPVIATDIRGCRQVVDEGVNGILFPVGDVAALVAAIRLIGSDAELRKRMGAASADIARFRFDERRVVDIVMERYVEAARRKGLEWLTLAGMGTSRLRRAVPGDAAAVAELHRRTITTGFLSTLGGRFLTLVYETLIAYERAVVIVAEHEGATVGFVAGVEDTSHFYRYFLRHRWLKAMMRLLPSLGRPTVWRGAVETLRYGGRRHDGSAELLAMAVAPAARGRGVGGELVTALTSWANNSGITAMKVVVGTENQAAIRLYERAGFLDPATIEVHTGEPSLELTWRS